MTVTRLIDRVPMPPGDQEEMAEWLLSWAKGFQAGEYGKFRSIVVVLESDDGRLGVISQSLGLLDRTRLVGLLTQAAHRRMDGTASIEDLAVDSD